MEQCWGALHEFDQYRGDNPAATRGLEVSIVEEIGRAVLKACAPFVSDKGWGEEGSKVSVLGESCVSHVAMVLFLARVARPDISTVVRRLCSEVSRWTTTCDQALLRLYGYLKGTPEHAIRGA